MTTGSSGAVFFLGTRAHYQVLQQPESHFDVENGNASTETIYQNPTVRDIWPEQINGQSERDSTSYVSERGNWSYCEQNEMEENKIESTGVKRRTKRRPSETALCERDNDMKPALLNSLGNNSTPKSKPKPRRSPLGFLASLARRARRLESDQMQYLQHLECALTSCTYKDSCRCLECQSRYFECDDMDELMSDDDDSSQYVVQPESPQRYSRCYDDDEDDEDDEVFIDTVPGDNTSTDLLIEGKEKMSVSSDEVDAEDEETMQLEVAAGTPVLLNYLLTHPITCCIQ